MPTVAANDFIDFVLAGGTTRRTIVARVVRQRQRPYAPALDFWFTLRRGLQNYFRARAADPGPLNELVEVADATHQARYRRAVRGFLRYRGRRQIEWAQPPQLRWTHAGLTVNCTPDVALQDRGNRYLLRLYYDLAPLPRARTAAMASLLSLAMHGHDANVMFGLLDLDRARIATAIPTSRWTETLEEDAASFMNYWNRNAQGKGRSIA